MCIFYEYINTNNNVTYLQNTLCKFTFCVREQKCYRVIVSFLDDLESEELVFYNNSTFIYLKEQPKTEESEIKRQ